MTIFNAGVRWPDIINQLTSRPESHVAFRNREKEMPGNVVAETLRGGLFTRIVGKRLLFFQEVGSTMDEARLRAERGTEEGTVIVAETQTSSRGRQGRNWVSRSGNLYLSVVLYPTLQTLPFLNSLCGVAVVRAISNISGLKPRIKWPNDILLDNKKVAGVLVETAIAGEQVHNSIVGIGINVALDADEIDEIAGGATSLNHASAGDIPRDELLREILEQLDSLYIQLNHGDTPIEEWEELLDTLGQRVRITWRGDEFVGVADGIDSQGSLLLRQDDGVVLTLAAGDAASLRQLNQERQSF